MLYGLPLLILLVSAAIAQGLWQTDFLTIVIAFTSFLITFLTLHHFYAKPRHTAKKLDTFMTVEPLHHKENDSCDT
jgi:positive regulator of sigma E activity